MSPKNAKYNYIFYKPTEKETSLSEYLHYSIEDDIYSENKKIALKRMIFLKRVHFLTQVASETILFRKKIY